MKKINARKYYSKFSLENNDPKKNPSVNKGVGGKQQVVLGKWDKNRKYKISKEMKKDMKTIKDLEQRIHLQQKMVMNQNKLLKTLDTQVQNIRHHKPTLKLKNITFSQSQNIENRNTLTVLRP